MDLWMCFDILLVVFSRSLCRNVSFISYVSCHSFQMGNLLLLCIVILLDERWNKQNPNMLKIEFSDFDKSKKDEVEKKNTWKKHPKSFEFDTLFFPLLCQRSMNHCFKNKFRYISIDIYLMLLLTIQTHTHTHTCCVKIGALSLLSIYSFFVDVVASFFFLNHKMFKRKDTICWRACRDSRQEWIGKKWQQHKINGGSRRRRRRRKPRTEKKSKRFGRFYFDDEELIFGGFCFSFRFWLWNASCMLLALMGLVSG